MDALHLTYLQSRRRLVSTSWLCFPLVELGSSVERLVDVDLWHQDKNDAVAAQFVAGIDEHSDVAGEDYSVAEKEVVVVRNGENVVRSGVVGLERLEKTVRETVPQNLQLTP